MGNISLCKKVDVDDIKRWKSEEAFIKLITLQCEEYEKKPERNLRPRRKRNCDQLVFAECPFNINIRRKRFQHLIFHETEFEKMALEGLRKLKLDEKHDGEFFNIPKIFSSYANDLLGMKIMLKYSSSSVSVRKLGEYPEAAYLREHIKYVTIYYIGHPYRKTDPYVVIRESHGKAIRKKVRKSKDRDMYTRIKIIKAKDYSLFIGKDFMLHLYPPERGSHPSEFAEGNGERPQALGHYTRMLDTNPQIFLEWKAYLYDWYNETPGPPYIVAELLKLNHPKLVI